MKRELADYKVVPRVYKVGEKTKVRIMPRGDHAKFIKGEKYELEIVPTEQSAEAQIEYSYHEANLEALENGSLEFSYTFSQEQRYILRILHGREERLEFITYAVESDLYQKRPLKGDFHVHSYRSDGHEEPAVVAANYRKNGFDFLAITDHLQWKPSKEAIDKFKDIPTELQLFYGEEVHSQGNKYIHTINFGGTKSVNEYYLTNTEKCDNEAKELAKTTPFNNPMDAIDYARRVWIANEIRKTGGLSILVHPHWLNNAFNMKDVITDALFENQVFDAYELLGGQSVFENTMQVAFYIDQRSKGRKIPVVGSSDSHGTEPAVYFGDEFTVVFAEDKGLEAIKNAVKGGYSTAVGNYNGNEHIAHGEYRMVKFTMFLLSEFYPEYVELCFEEGRAIKAQIVGEEENTQLLTLLKDRTSKYYNEFYGK